MNQSPHRQLGFTLLEIMLVVVIISLSASLVVQTIPTNKNDHAKQEATRFYERMKLLSDEALLQGKDFGINIDEDKQRITYLSFKENTWQKMDIRQFTQVQLEDSVDLVLSIGNGAWNDEDSLFTSDDLFENELEIESSFEEEVAIQPNLFALSSGDITPFLLTFRMDDAPENRDNWRVKVNAVGEVQLFAPGENDEDE